MTEHDEDQVDQAYDTQAHALLASIERNVNSHGVDGLMQLEAAIALAYAVLYVGDQIRLMRKGEA